MKSAINQPLGVKFLRFLDGFTRFLRASHSKSKHVCGLSTQNEVPIGNQNLEEKIFVNKILKDISKLRTAGEISDAVEKLRSINIKYPHQKAHWKQYANMLALSGAFEDALKYFRKLAEENPSDVTFKLRIADCCTGLQEHAEAVEVLEELFPYAGGKQKYVSDRLTHHRNLLRQRDPKIERRTIHGKQLYEQAAIELCSEQERILFELKKNGIAISSFDKLIGDNKLFLQGIEEYEEFIQNELVRELIFDLNKCEDFNSDPKFKGKHVPSKITYDEFFGTLASNRSISKTLMHDRVLQVAWSYYETACKLRNPLMWVNPKVNKNNISGRKGSQLWHRDQEDASILKCFIYYSDINEQTGATEYLKRSCERYQNSQFAFHPFPFSSGYPNQKFFEKKINEGDVVSASGEMGTIVFLDTNGFHRGGFVLQGQRHISMCTFIRPQSPVFEKGKSIKIVASEKLSKLQAYSCS